jgi:hypothetical protein
MLRKALFLAVVFSATIVAAQDYSYILSPTVIDGNAGKELPAGCVERVRTEVGEGITAALGPRLTTLSADRLLKEDDRVLELIPTITIVRDFKEIIVGSITRHNLVVTGHLQVVDPWSNFTIASIPRLVEASTDVGFAESGREDTLVADACQQASRQWAIDVSGRAVGMGIASTGRVEISPLTKSFQRKAGGVLLAGSNQQLAEGNVFRSTAGEYFKILDAQPTYSIIELLSNPSAKVQKADSAVIKVKDNRNGQKPLIAIDADDLSDLLNALDPEARMDKSQLSGIFGGYLARSEAIDLLMESAMEENDLSFRAFDAEISRLSEYGTGGSEVSADRRTLVKLRRDASKLNAKLQLAAYSHTIEPQSDGSNMHVFLLAIRCELTGEASEDPKRQIATVFEAEIRRRIEKKGVREIDNRQTMALLTRSVLIKVASGLEKYLTSEYIPKEIRSRETYHATISSPRQMQWPRTPSPNTPVRTYRVLHLSSQEQRELNATSAEALEFKGMVTPLDLASGASKIAESGDGVVYTMNSGSRRTPVAVRMDLPADFKYREFVTSSVSSVIQGTLAEYKREDVQLVFPGPSDWPSVDSGSVNLILSEAEANISPTGCVATFILRTWAAPTTSILSTFDKSKLFYKGSKYTSDPIATGSKDVCLATAVMQYLPAYRKSIDGAALSKQVYGN